MLLLLQQCFHCDVFPFTACSVCAGLEMGLGQSSAGWDLSLHLDTGFSSCLTQIAL